MTSIVYRQEDPFWHLVLLAAGIGVAFTVVVFGLWEGWKRLRLRGGHR